MKSIINMGRLLGVCLAAAALLPQGVKAQSNIVTYPTGNDMVTNRTTHHALVLPDGRAAVLGNITVATITTNWVEVFDTTTRRFQVAGRLMDTRWVESAAVLNDGRILVTGGRTNLNQTSPTPSTEIFDPATGLSVYSGNLNIPRFSAKAVTLNDGRVLIVGGSGNVGSPSPLPSELYDPATGQFSLTASLLVTRAVGVDQVTTTKLNDGRILFAGGPATNAVNAEIFDPVTETFHFSGPMVARRAWHTATLLPDGRVVIIGGANTTLGVGFTNLVEVFDPVTETFSALGTNIVMRRNHSATLLPDGKILVAGGHLPTANGTLVTTSSVEIFDPATGISEYAGELAVRRGEHRVAALPSGQVLITGGRVDTLPQRTAEIFDHLMFWRPENLYTFFQDFSGMILQIQQLTGLYSDATNTIWGLSVTNSNLQGQLTYANDTITGLLTTNGQLQAELDALQPNPFRLLPGLVPIRLRIFSFPLSDERVVLMHGINMDNPGSRIISIFDPRNESYAHAGFVTQSRVGFAGNILPDDRIMLAGGTIQLPTSNPITNSTEIYTPGTTNTVPGPSMFHARLDPLSVNLSDGRVLIMGGRNATTNFVAQSEIYEPSNNSFRLSGVMPGRIMLATVTRLLDDRVLIVGINTNSTIAEVQIFDPATETFRMVSAAFTGRIGHQASLLADGRVIISGGRSGSPNVALSSTVIFDPATEGFTSGPNLLVARFNFSSTTLPDGTVLIAGGQTNLASVPATVTTEIYDPVTGSISAGSNMMTNQYSHTAVLLGNGTVLFSGGGTGPTSVYVNRAQIYDPLQHVPTSQYGNLQLLISDLEAENDDLAAQLASVQLQIDIATNTITGLTITNASLQAALVNANTTIAGLVVTNAQLQADLEACQAAKAALITQINTLTNEIAQLQGTIATLTAQNNALTNQVTQQQATITSLTGQVNSLTNQVAQQQGTINTLTAQNNALTNQVAQLQATISSLQSQNNALTNQVATLMQQNTQLQAALTAEQAQNATLTAQVTQQAALIASLQAQNTSLTNQVATLTAQNTQLQTQVTGSQNQVNSLVAAFQVEFNDPTFVIPGATLQEQIQNLIAAILELNHGQRSALYDNLD